MNNPSSRAEQAAVTPNPASAKPSGNRRVWRLLALLGLLLTTLLPGQINWHRHLRAPKSAVILEFEQAFQIRIEGRRSDGSAQEKLLFTVAEAPHQLRPSRYPATNLTLRIVPDSFWQRSLAHQVNAVLNRAATYHAGVVTLFPGPRSDGFQLRELLHELKHYQHEQVRAAHPEFDEQWASLNREHGYRSLPRRLRSLFSKPAPVEMDPTGVEESSNVDPYWWARGYVTAYAATNLEEDIAELCSLTEDRDADKMFYLILKECPAREIYRRKLALAEHHGLIATNFVSYVFGYFAAVEQLGEPAAVVSLPHIVTNNTTLSAWAAYAWIRHERPHSTAAELRDRYLAATQLPFIDLQATVQLATLYEGACYAAGGPPPARTRRAFVSLKHALNARSDFRVFARPWPAGRPAQATPPVAADE